MYPQSKLGIPTLKQSKIYALVSIFIELESEDKVKITVTPETVCDTLRPQGVSTHTKFGIPVSNYIKDMLQTQFRFGLTDCQLCVGLAPLPMVYIFLSLFVLRECVLMLMTSTTETYF